MSEASKKTSDRPLQCARVILCEGADEYEILVKLREEKKLTEADIEIQNAGGRTNLEQKLDDLRYQTGGAGVRLVCVVLDAEDRKPREVRIKNGLMDIADKHGWKLRLFELPNDKDAGGLETLVRLTVDGSTQQAQCANNWEQCLGGVQTNRTQANKDKAWLHVWLAGFDAIKSRLSYAFLQNPTIRQQLQEFEKKFEEILTQTLEYRLE
jgi:hypothetical protein